MGLVGGGGGIRDGEDRALLVAEQLVLPLRHMEISDRARNCVATDLQVRHSKVGGLKLGADKTCT